MGKIIAITDPQGAIGKTTTAVNLSVALAMKGESVLLIDGDPLANATKCLGIEAVSGKTIYDLLLGKCRLDQCICSDISENLSLIPANIELSGLELDVEGDDNREFLLKPMLQDAKNRYDYVLIDCPSNISLFTINAMTSADSILIPIQCELYSLKAIMNLIKTIGLVKEKNNPDLTVEGILLTLYDSSSESVKKAKDKLGDLILDTIISRDGFLAEASGRNETVFTFAPDSIGAKNYKQLADDIIDKNSRGIGFKQKACVNREDLSGKTRFALAQLPGNPVKTVLNISVKGDGINETIHSVFPDAEITDARESIWDDFISIKSESADLIIAVESIFLWDNSEYVFRELNRILTSCGCLVIVFDKSGRNMSASGDWACGMGRGKKRTYNYCAIRESLRQNLYSNPVKWDEIQGNYIEEKNWESVLACKGGFFP